MKPIKYPCKISQTSVILLISVKKYIFSNKNLLMMCMNKLCMNIMCMNK